MVKGIPYALLFVALTSISVSNFSCTKKKTASDDTSTPTQAFVFNQKPTGPILFLSTQLNPVEEAWKMRNVILKDFPGSVDFRPNDNAYLAELLESELKKGPSSSILIGALHGDLMNLYEKNALQPLNSIYQTLNSSGISKNLVELSKFDGNNMFYIPWMQASFVMVANKKAMKYLPKGADLNSLTYDQLLTWTATIYSSTQKKVLGFPAGEKGLMHRFFQGYLYPSFTASTLLKFRSPEAIEMWTYFKTLWNYVQPNSIVYSTMSEPLLIDEVWIAWDHTARLIKALQERPNDFIAFPAPRGPKGRGFLAVISGLSLPKSEADTNNAEMLIQYLSSPEIQDRVLSQTGFSPVVERKTTRKIPIYLEGLDKTISYQLKAKDSLLTLMPIGLGAQANNYNTYFMLTFSEIVLENKDIGSVLDKNAAKLQFILNQENVKCWLPDISDERPCKIE